MEMKKYVHDYKKKSQLQFQLPNIEIFFVGIEQIYLNL